MTSIALVGRGESAIHLPEIIGKCDKFWGVSFAYKDWDFLDRIYEVHPDEVIADPNYHPSHWDWLQKERERPRVVRLTDDLKQKVFDLGGVSITGGHPRRDIILSSFDFMMADAISHNPTIIYIYGWDMYRSEYQYQRPGAFFWIGVARGRGIDVRFPMLNNLVPPVMRRYAIDGMLGTNVLSSDEVAQLESMVQGFQDDLKAVETRDDDHRREVGRLYVIAEGAKAAIQFARDAVAVEGYAPQPLIEKERIKYYNEKISGITRLNFHKGAAMVARQLGDQGRAEQHEAEALKLAKRFFVAMGAEQAAEWMEKDCEGTPHQYQLKNEANDFALPGASEDK